MTAFVNSGSFVPLQPPDGGSGGGGGGGGADFQAFDYTVTGAEPDLANLVIPIPVALASTNYAVFAAQAQFTNLLAMGVLPAGKAVAQFVLNLSAPATAGDVFDFIVAPRTA